MDHWWPTLSIRSIPITFTATTKRSQLSTLGRKAAKGKRERKNLLIELFSKIWSIVETKCHDSSVRIEIKWRPSINSPNRFCWENTRGPSLELARAFLFHAKRTMPCNAYAISHCPTLPLLSPSFLFSSIITRATKFFLSLSYLSLDCCSLYQGVHGVPLRYPFEPRRGSSDGFMIENTRDKTPAQTQSRKYERSEIMRKQATGRRLN